MPSLIERIDQMAEENRERIKESKASGTITHVALQEPAPRKSLFNGGVDGWLWSALATGRNHNLRNDQMGYALAYLLVPDVRASVDIYAWQIAGILNRILFNSSHDRANDKVVAQSDDVTPRHLFYAASRRHRRVHKIPFLMRLAYMYVLFDEMYILPQANRFGFKTDFAVLNTLAVEPNIMSGELVGYWYNSGMGRLELGLDDLAYDHGFSPLDDLRGSSILQTAIDNINILRNLVRYLTDFFANNARPGVIASFKTETTNQAAVDLLKEELQKYHKGLGKQFTNLISPIPLDYQTLENPDVKRQYALEEPVVRQIYRAFGVPLAMVGDTQATTYKEAPAMLKTFVNMRLKPHLHNIEDFITDSVLPLMPDTQNQRFEFELSAFQIVTDEDVALSQKVTAEWQSGLVAMDKAQAGGGMEVDDWSKDRYFIDGLPVPRDLVDQIIEKRFFVETPSTPAVQPDVEETTITDEDEVDPDDTDTQLDPTPPDSEKAHDHEPEALVTWDYSREKARKELINWQRKVKAHKPFTPHYTRGDIADLITSCLHYGGDTVKTFDMAFSILDNSIDKLKDAFVGLVSAIEAGDAQAAIKSLQSIRIDFELDFEDVLNEIRNGNIDNRRRAGNILRQLIRTFGARAYRQGLADGGILDDPSDEEQAEINAMIAGESGFVSNITRVLIREDGITDTQAAGKPEMWFNKSIMKFYQAGLLRAQANGLFEWVVGRTEHCSDCLRLNEQRHRLKHWSAKGWLPQSKKLECGGFRCQCRLVPVSGKARGKF